jgi:hypothetical protein
MALAGRRGPASGGGQQLLQRQRNFSEKHFLPGEYEEPYTYTDAFVAFALNGPLKTFELQKINGRRACSTGAAGPIAAVYSG